MKELVYYKIYITSFNSLCIVELQWFDEKDYTAESFLKDSKGKDFVFNTRKKAEEYLFYLKQYIQ